MELRKVDLLRQNLCGTAQSDLTREMNISGLAVGESVDAVMTESVVIAVTKQ
jgi:hypothetical protein